MADAALGQLVDAEGLSNCVPVAWHYSSGDPWYTPEAASRFSYYGGGGVPFCMWDGTEKAVGAYPNNIPAQLAWYQSIYYAHRNNPSPMTITFLSAGYAGGRACVKVHLQLEQSLSPGHVCHIVLWEDHLTYNGDWRFIERAMATRDVLIYNPGNTQDISVEFTLNGTWVTGNLGVSVIVQEPNTKVVAQGNAKKLAAATAITPTSLGRVKAMYY